MTPMTYYGSDTSWANSLVDTASFYTTTSSSCPYIVAKTIGTGSFYKIEPTNNYIAYEPILYSSTASTLYTTWGDTSTSWWWDHGKDYVRPKTPQERLKEILQRRQAPMVFASRKPIVAAVDPREMRARETLRLCLGEEKFRSFIKNGFVTARGKSGLVYQIFPGHGITAVYKNGQMIERLCVVFRGDFPPADSLIMRFLLILNDEAEFRSHAIKHGVTQRQMAAVATANLESLPDIYRRLKAS